MVRRRFKVNKQIRAKNYNTLDPLSLDKPSFSSRLSTARARKYHHWYTVIELFSLTTNGRLAENGNILLPHKISLPKTKRPRMRILQYGWKLVRWWKQWERWILFDSLTYETKMSRLLRSHFKGENLLVFIKKINFLFDPETYVLKIVDVKTGEFVLTNPVALATIFRKKRRVSTLFEELDVFPDDVKASVIASDILKRSRNIARLRAEIEKGE